LDYGHEDWKNERRKKNHTASQGEILMPMDRPRLPLPNTNSFHLCEVNSWSRRSLWSHSLKACVCFKAKIQAVV
jgi:hypothetical protein